jgi:Holliday junction resolvase
LQRPDTAIEILLERPAETIVADSTISDRALSAKIVASPRIDPSLLKIGVKVAPDGQKASRSSIGGATLSWTAQDDGLIAARVEQDVGDTPVCQVFLSYAGHHISRWWVGDPTRLPNQRAAFLAQFDKDLAKLREELLSRESRGHPFERILAIVLEEVGFDCMYLGEVSHLQEAPDIYCETPSRRVAVIECAATVTNSSEKLSKLQQRVLRIKESFASQRLGHVQIIGVLVTKHSDAEIEPFAEEASRFGLCIVGIAALTRLADGLRFRVQPDELYDRLLNTASQQSADLFPLAGANQISQA